MSANVGKWRSTLTEETLLPISMAIALASFAFWLATVSAETKTNTKDIEHLHTDAHETDKALIDQADRLGRMEGKLDAIYTMLERKR